MIAILDYGIGNLRSAQKALERAGAAAQLVQNADDALSADGVVLPGVGAFGSCMNALRNSGLDKAVYQAIERNVPFLGICVGLQLLFDSSDESPDVEGLGVISGRVRKMTGDIKLPQMQWNQLQVRTASPLLEGLGDKPWCYFVHSFAGAPEDDNVVAATCDYGGEVPALLQRDRIWATQFHPEKSSRNGLQILANFAALTESPA